MTAQTQQRPRTCVHVIVFIEKREAGWHWKMVLLKHSRHCTFKKRWDNTQQLQRQLGQPAHPSSVFEKSAEAHLSSWHPQVLFWDYTLSETLPHKHHYGQRNRNNVTFKVSNMEKWKRLLGGMGVLPEEGWKQHLWPPEWLLCWYQWLVQICWLAYWRPRCHDCRTCQHHSWWNQMNHVISITKVPHFKSNNFAHYQLKSFAFAWSGNSCFPHLLARGSLQCTKYSAALSEPRQDGDSIVSAFRKKTKKKTKSAGRKRWLLIWAC